MSDKTPLSVLDETTFSVVLVVMWGLGMLVLLFVWIYYVGMFDAIGG